MFKEIKLCEEEFSKNNNVISFLKTSEKSSTVTSEMIEIAYDLQSGSYVDYASKNTNFMRKIVIEMASFLKPYISSGDSLLDVGTGEMTTLGLLMDEMHYDLDLYAFDVSLSRLVEGVKFCNQISTWIGNANIFSADMTQIPLLNKSIDIVMSYHSLEPNGGKESALLQELFRICRKKLILFEPSYENASDAARARMDKLSYVKNLSSVAKCLGAKIELVKKMNFIYNDLNPTYVYVIQPPHTTKECIDIKQECFSDPGHNTAIIKNDNFFLSPNFNVVYPIISGIPILREKYAILGTALLK